MPRALRVWFWRFGATAPLGLKWGLFGSAFPFEGNWEMAVSNQQSAISPYSFDFSP